MPVNSCWAYLPKQYAPSRKKQGGIMSIYEVSFGRVARIHITANDYTNGINRAVMQTLASNIPAETIVDFSITYYQD